MFQAFQKLTNQSLTPILRFSIPNQQFIPFILLETISTIPNIINYNFSYLNSRVHTYSGYTQFNPHM